MKIKSVKISNILSFPFIEDIDDADETIVFDLNTNILIGPNGSGKSNMIEILSKLLQSYFFIPFDFQDQNIGSNGGQVFTGYSDIDIRLPSLRSLVKHRDCKDKESKLIVKLNFDQDDISNLNFFAQNYKKFQEYLAVSSQISNSLGMWNSEQIHFQAPFDISFSFIVDNQIGRQVKIQLDENNLTEKEKFSHSYLLNFNVIQRLIDVALIKGQNDQWKNLKNSFALIGSMRQYGGFERSMSIGMGLGKESNKLLQESSANSTKENMIVGPIFQMTFLNLGQKVRSQQYLERPRHPNDSIEELLTKDSVLKRINDALAGINLRIAIYDFNQHQMAAKVDLYNEKNEKVEFTELSTGQKSIFYLVFAIYGLDLENGLLIIDEPELHLHASMQKKYFQILNKISASFNLQVILATHSPVFIDESTIKNTFRFAMREGSSTITQPKADIGQTQKDLLQILTYTNSSRIFFSDVVILVEGDSDEYFFKYFYENYYLSKRNVKLSVEFLSIGGKGNRKRWVEFLDMFEISNAFIGDLDNVKEMINIDFASILSSAKEDAISRVYKQIKISESLDGKALLHELDRFIANGFIITDTEKDNLKNLWQYILKRNGMSNSYLYSYFKNPENSNLFQKIKAGIIQKYSENIFILQKGDLESYLGIDKDINNVIQFCLNDFESWVDIEERKSDDDSKTKELMKIMDSIVKGDKIGVLP